MLVDPPDVLLVVQFLYAQLRWRHISTSLCLFCPTSMSANLPNFDALNRLDIKHLAQNPRRTISKDPLKGLIKSSFIAS